MEVYLDYNSTAPILPSIRECVRPYLEDEFGNPSSRFSTHGQRAHRAIEGARAEVAALLRVDPEEVVMTSGGTESIFAALVGAFRAHRDRRHLIFTAVEHPALIETAEFLRDLCGVESTIVGVDPDGELDLPALRSAFRPETGVVSCMLANNETGVLSPLAEVVREARRWPGVVVHTDAVQAIGKIPVDVGLLGVDLLSLTGHKLGALKGTGALIVRRGTLWDPVVKGGGQEGGRRGGTEGVCGIVALGEAARCARIALEQGEPARIEAMRELFESGLEAELSRCGVALRFNGVRSRDRSAGGAGDVSRLPNTTSVIIDGVLTQEILPRLAARGVTASPGSACKAHSVEPSHVLRAMGRSVVDALGAVRFSLGSGTTAEQIRYAIEVICEEVVAARRHTAGELGRMLSA